MPEQHFSVHIDPDELARRDLTVAVAAATGTTGQQPATGDSATTARHGLRDTRQAARRRSDRDHAGRATGGSTRSYAFRRS